MFYFNFGQHKYQVYTMAVQTCTALLIFDIISNSVIILFGWFINA